MIAKVDNTVATTIGAIAVAALSGLTILAYKHPQAYKKLSLFLNGITILGWTAGIINIPILYMTLGYGCVIDYV